MKLEKIFKEILNNKINYTGSADGDQFEQKFRSILKSNGFTEIIHVPNTKKIVKDIALFEQIEQKEALVVWNNLKKAILHKTSLSVVKNPFKKIKNTFIFQPTGPQNFPDFIVILEKFVIAIEIKFTKNDGVKKISTSTSRPMWNSNLPKANAIYIYGVAQKDVTFFLGSDVLIPEVREDLINYFTLLDSEKITLNSKLNGKENPFGFYPYVRKAFEHKKQHATYKNSQGIIGIESYFSEQAVNREKNVIEFLEGLE